jgi:hypothetical protein
MDPVSPDGSSEGAALLEVDINGRWRQDVQMQYDPNKVGRHSVEIPPGVLQPGINRIDFRVLSPSESTVSSPPNASAFRLWYLRLAPR